jgi:uncharacterized protein (DUF2249 family)
LHRFYEDREVKDLPMTHCVDRKVNITPLPTDHREDCLIEAFEHLEPGETMQAIDDFDPGWIQGLLGKNCDVTLEGDDFDVDTNAGRYVVFISKPETVEA